MKSYVALVLGGLVVLGPALVPVGYRSRTSVEYRNFRVVADGELYRSGQMTPDGFRRVVCEYGIGTVVSLRDTLGADGVHDDQAEADFCAANGVSFLRFPLAGWTPVGGVVPGDKNVSEFVRLFDDPAVRRPVLVHCFAGIHRTGPQCAAYRMEYQGWSAAEATDEMLRMGTVRTRFDRDLLDYLEGYRLKRPQAAGPASVVGGWAAGR